MPSDFELAQWEKIAVVIYITAYIIIFIAADKIQQAEIKKKICGQASSRLPPTSQPTPAQLSVISSLLTGIATVILEQVAGIRLVKVEKGIQAGTQKGSAIPNFYITTGWIISIIGSLFRIIGSVLIEEQERPITLL